MKSENHITSEHKAGHALSLRIPAADYATLRTLAQAEYRSVNNLVIVAIKEFLAGRAK